MSINSKMTAIADAIRGKTGGTDALSLDGMAAAIAGIQTGGGGSGSLCETGEFIGDGAVHKTNPLQLPVSFEPDLLFIVLKDRATALDANHVVGGIIVRDTIGQTSYRNANTTTMTNGGFDYCIDGMYGSGVNHAEYTDGIVSWAIHPASRGFYNGAVYTWIARKW